MDFRLYLSSRRIEHKEAAKELQVTPTTLSNYLCGRRLPRVQIMQRIYEFTKGKVTAEDILKNWREKNERKKSA